jgi:long-chain acyl-CoA synthetase
MQYKSLTRETLLSYFDDYAKHDSATVFAHKRGLRLARWSYEELVLTARQTACEFQSRGIGEGDCVILCGGNSPEWAAAFWGCLLVGAVVVPLDRETSVNFAFSVQQQTQAKLVIASHDATGVKKLDTPSVSLDVLVESVSHHHSGPISTPKLSDTTLAEIIFTSGTTSTPKGVMLTHGNLLANLLPLEYEIAKYLKWELWVHPIRFLNLVPLSHVFGQMMGLFVPQLLGGEVHFHDSLNPAGIVERTRKNRISVVVLVPRVLESLRQWLERNEGNEGNRNDYFARVDLHLLRRWWKFRKIHRRFGWKFWAFLSGGATLEERTESFWRNLGIGVLQGYGMTETASLISVRHPFKSSNRSIGKLMPGYEVKLEDSGEIVVRGPSVSPGYWTPAGRASRAADQWLHTGDVGMIDAAGNLHFKGRTKEVIVTAGGLNIYPEDLEEALNRQPEVRSCCVIKWQGQNGDEPMAVLILNDRQSKVDKIIERANDSLQQYQQIHSWHVWDAPDFPRTATHKILKREVAAKIESESSSEVPDHSQSVVLFEATRITGAENPSGYDTSLKLTTDLKLDSLGRIELLSALEDKYQIDIDEAAFTDATTVGDVERIVRGGVVVASTPFPYPTWSHKFPVTWIRALLFYTIILPVTLVMSRMRVEGVEHIKKLNEPILFIANHVTLGDHALILAALPFRLRHRLAIAMDGERLRGWLNPPAGTGTLVRFKMLAQFVLVTTFFQVFPLPKISGFRRSFAYAAECVEHGLSLLVFPEGERAPKDQMHMGRFKSGIGLLATELAIPVVPVKLDGLYELKRRKQYFASKGMVAVKFGSPVRFSGASNATEVAEELQRRLEAL